jgi:hypothetical protein
MKTKNVLGAIRRHPGRALAICVPLVAASVFTGTTFASAQPEATLTVSPSQAAATPGPDVIKFNSSPPGTQAVKKTQVVNNKYDRPIPEPANLDGCDHDYGQPDQCVPWQIPASSPQAACVWLRANGFGPLKVYGTNRQNLPENAEGYVCAGAS